MPAYWKALSNIRNSPFDCGALSQKMVSSTGKVRGVLERLTGIVSFMFVVQLWAVPVGAANGSSATPDWPMYQYNAQHTGYNDQSRITPPLALDWWAQPFDTSRKLNELAIADGRLLVTSGDDYWRQQNKTSLKCYNSRSGRFEWQYLFDLEWSTFGPAAAFGDAYVQAEPGSYTQLNCIDLQTGLLKWSVTEREQFADKLAPTIFGDRVVTAAGAYQGLMCVDAHTGVKYWSENLGHYEKYTPAIWHDTLYLFSNGYFVAMSVETGDHLWYMNILAPKAALEEQSCMIMYMGTAPVLDTIEQIAYLMWHLSLTAVDVRSRSVLWHRNGDFGCGINPCTYKGQVFAIDSGMMKCLDGYSGTELWRFRSEVSLKYPPVAANRYVFVANDSATYCLDVESHQQVWEGPYGGKLAIAGDWLYVATDGGWVIAYRGETVTDAPDEPESMPRTHSLHQNYPNPFNPTTTIKYTLPSRSMVRLAISDLLGRQVKVLIAEEIAAGEHVVEWDGKTETGAIAASGIYLYRLTTAWGSTSKKMLLLH